MNQIVSSAIREHIELATKVERELAPTLEPIASALCKCLAEGGKIYWCGNGGSAADSQHLAAELVGRFKRERRALGSVALTTDSSVLTCLANDYSYADVFQRQVEALVNKNDVLIGISTSGKSENVLKAMKKAKELGAITVGFLGRDGGTIRHECNFNIIIPSADTARIQEMHIMFGHILCDLVEQRFAQT